ncbi:N-acylglucosamine-6-phosphate 2-epimerase [Georgenia satyanarayanai]|uniref:Putative N-acetylmannosamine-6-phosphate 2-epimerase n=1 Tax=Georgenia satyanarayanai TaxID=860221 RepID=A0A2Y9A9Z4_9MICO|nr:N-acetylmannosamine-6-phosphate 2-epimerase [Georgenia satyanarayanai]PYG00085.1 N-acylglucosamine-6-phosphate 2-epimerase [Georgenia satyanarayanai]SSA40108.1 N-acylglucosamine-6-phosphate 2-epimerase [Georgenia satyanarayanai]
MSPILERLRGRLIVSCQAYPGEPLRVPEVMQRMAQAVVAGGAAGLRAQGLEDIRLIAASTDVPLTGLWKDGEDDVFITPTLEHAIAVADAGADIVALDGTRRPRPDGRTLAETIAGLRAHADVLVMADCGSLDDALAAEDAGADVVGTTLAGYSGEREKTDGPDVALIDQLVARCRRPVVVEGRVHTPAQAADAIDRGAFAVVVGTAITHPTTITSWFDAAVTGRARR